MRDVADGGITGFRRMSGQVDDLLISSPLHSLPGRSLVGDVKVILGSGDSLPSSIDLAEPPANLLIYRIVGTDGIETRFGGGDRSSNSISVGDIDGDGYPMLPSTGWAVTAWSTQ